MADDVVANARPTMLIGTSTQAGAFTEAIVRDMASSVERPIIMPLPSRRRSACRHALDAEAVDVGLVGRMLERATEAGRDQPAPAAGEVVAGRFARDPGEFAVDREAAR